MGILPKSPARPWPTPPKQPRLRASCDGCFLAKVKCSKARPVCSRCLAVGLVCRYSPSSRAMGRGQHARGRAQKPQSPQTTTTTTTSDGVGDAAASAAKSETTLLASTLSEESYAWLARGTGFETNSPGIASLSLFSVPSSPRPATDMWYQAIADQSLVNDGADISRAPVMQASGTLTASTAVSTCLSGYSPIAVKATAMTQPCVGHHHPHHHQIPHKISSSSRFPPQWLICQEQLTGWTPLGDSMFPEDGGVYAEYGDSADLSAAFSYADLSSGGFDYMDAGAGSFQYP